MSDYPEIATRFARDTAKHEMTVLHDDGLYRHLRFRPRQYGEYWFDLVTVPGALIFQGDGETYAFRRLEDMFQFFRTGIHRGGSLHINPGYWSEKLSSNRDAVMAYSQDLFSDEVARELKYAEEGYPGITEAWNEHVEAEFNTEYEEEARRALEEFEFGEDYKARCRKCGQHLVAKSHTEAIRWMTRHRQELGDKHAGSVESLAFTFQDTWEWSIRDYQWWFLWACQAIVWGISRHDKVVGYGLEKLAARSTKAVAA